MFVKRVFSILVTWLSVLSLVHAGVGDWKNYTSMKSVRGITLEGKRMWAATSGGLFGFDTVDSTFRKITNIEGLTTADLSAVGVDANGSLWIGAMSGSIDVYSVSANTWQHISDISTASGKTKKGIYRFYFVGDSVFIATDFGVSVFSQQRFEFEDSYEKLGTFSSPTRANSVIVYDGRIWIATAQGIASASTRSLNLKDPAAWTNYLASSGLPSNSVNALGLYAGRLYAGTDAGLSIFTGTTWESVSGDLLGTKVVDIIGFYVATTHGLYQMSSGGALTKVGTDLPYTISSVAVASTEVWIGLDGGGIAHWNAQQAKWDMKLPNSPNSNLFASIAVDNRGVLWAASGKDGAGQGFYSFDGTTWTNYSVADYPLLRSNDYHKVAIGCDNSKWICSWGKGVVLIKNDSTLTRFDQTNAGLAGIPNAPEFVVVSGAACDSKGNTWIVNYMNAANITLAVMKSDSTWTSYTDRTVQGSAQFADVAVDGLGTKWITPYLPAAPSPKGLYYFNEVYRLPDATDDGWGYLGKADGLESDNVTTVVVDRTGDIWVGTDAGISIISNVRDPKKGVLTACHSTRCNVSGQYINTIAVDALNNKWVGTKTSGVWVLSSDGTTVLAQYNTSNSPLLDNDIKSIAIDHDKGIVYFGTDKGLSGLQTAYYTPKQSFSSLFISPNPFFLPSTSSLSIDGLVEESSIKVLAIDGKVITEFASPGGRVAFWDGTDSRGKLVSSGVYLVVAYSADGNQITTAKVAVIRR